MERELTNIANSIVKLWFRLDRYSVQFEAIWEAPGDQDLAEVCCVGIHTLRSGQPDATSRNPRGEGVDNPLEPGADLWQVSMLVQDFQGGRQQL